MHITVNGTQMETLRGCSIRTLLNMRNITTPYVVVEVNKAVVKKETWETAVLNDGDCVEIVTFVGGG